MKPLRILARLTCFACLATSLTAAENQAGWKPIFNGANLDGLYVQLRGKAKNEDPERLVQAVGGELHFYKDAVANSQQPFGYVATQAEYSDYHLRLEFKWGEKKFAPRAKAKRDSGLLYHVTGEEKVWPVSVEYQIQEGDVGDVWTVSTTVAATVNPATTNLITTIRTNRTTGVVRTNRDAQPVFLSPDKGGVPFVQGGADTSLRIARETLNERDGWNVCEVIVTNGTAIHILNGKTINWCRDFRQMVAGEWQPLRKGKIALQLEGSEVIYRNLAIREISP